MKNRKYLAVFVLTIMAAVLSGCKKEKSPQNDVVNDNQTFVYQETKQWPYQYTGYLTYYEYRRTVDHLGNVHLIWDPHCAFPDSGWCLPEVTVVANKNNEQNSLAILFMRYYEEGKANLFFKTQDYLGLFPDLIKLPYIANAIINDEIVIFERYNKDTSTHYYIGLPKKYQNEPLSENGGFGDWIEAEVLCTFVIKDLR